MGNYIELKYNDEEYRVFANGKIQCKEPFGLEGPYWRYCDPISLDPTPFQKNIFSKIFELAQKTVNKKK